uniref:RNase H type-1 domain-containing protein n=1 Tax=Arion vulgaris TaxID=1028688 RepID=A0A0B7B9V5_9EUPU
MHAEIQGNKRADHLTDTVVVKEGQSMYSEDIINAIRTAGRIDDLKHVYICISFQSEGNGSETSNCQT